MKIQKLEDELTHHRQRHSLYVNTLIEIEIALEDDQDEEEALMIVKRALGKGAD